MLKAREAAAVRVVEPKDVRRAAEAFRDVVSSLVDFRVAPCHNIARKDLMVDSDGNVLATEVFGWSGNGWWTSPRLALDSPLPAACRYEAEPFWVNAQGFRTRQPNRYLDAIDRTKFEQRALTRAAIVVPVHLPFGQIGAVGFSPADRDRTDLGAEYEAFGDELGFYARTFIASYVQAMCPSRRIPLDTHLSKREVECLRWAAIGKTDEEISMIMSRSRATVRFHIHNAQMKLDAVSRSQTVFKAAQLGYLGPAN